MTISLKSFPENFKMAAINRFALCVVCFKLFYLKNINIEDEKGHTHNNKEEDLRFIKLHLPLYFEIIYLTQLK